MDGSDLSPPPMAVTPPLAWWRTATVAVKSLAKSFEKMLPNHLGCQTIIIKRLQVCFQWTPKGLMLCVRLCHPVSRALVHLLSQLACPRPKWLVKKLQTLKHTWCIFCVCGCSTCHVFPPTQCCNFSFIEFYTAMWAAIVSQRTESVLTWKSIIVLAIQQDNDRIVATHSFLQTLQQRVIIRIESNRSKVKGVANCVVCAFYWHGIQWPSSGSHFQSDRIQDSGPNL